MLISIRELSARPSLHVESPAIRFAGIWPALIVILMCGIAMPHAAAQERPVLSSPDKRISLRVYMPQPRSFAMPEWSATFRGKEIMSGRLDLQVAGEGSLLDGVSVRAERRSRVDERIPVLFGKSA